MKKFFSDELYLYQSYANGIIFRCVHEAEMLSVFEVCHYSFVVGTIVVSRLGIRFCTMGIIGQPFMKIYPSSLNHMVVPLR